MKDAMPIPSFSRSTHFRITLWYTVLLGLVSIAFGLFIYLNQTRDIFGESRFRVSGKLDEAWRAYDRGSSIVLQEGDSYAIFDDAGGIVAMERMSGERALGLVKAAIADRGRFLAENGDRHGKPLSWTVEKQDSELLFGYLVIGRAGHGDAEGHTGAILFGSPLDPYGLRRRLLLTILIAVVSMMVIAMLSGAWLANRAMRPVAQIARTARLIGEGDLSRRINLTTRDELGELSEVFDSMFDRLEASFERQKSFVADAGHELRTPLSLISLESERALAMDRGAEEYRESLSVVRTECGYMAKLVEDLLLLARADSGAGGENQVPVDVSDVALEAMERFAPLAARRGVVLSAGELPELRVRSDRTALATAIGNLIDNAVKFAPRGSRVVVELESKEGRALLSVKDSGPGIPADKLGRVFDRFYRVDESRAETEGKPAGSGLGLSIVKAIVESHGGTVFVTSELGRGSKFGISLPLLH